jgi:hypothetical protein
MKLTEFKDLQEDKQYSSFSCREDEVELVYNIVMKNLWLQNHLKQNGWYLKMFPEDQKSKPKYFYIETSVFENQ